MTNPLNSYGGTFVGFRSTGDVNNKGNDSRVVCIKLGALKHLSLPKLEKPCKREFFVTVVFDTDSLEETMEHQRNRSVIRLGDFENGYYTCSFNEHTMTLPCKGKNFVRLYLSCISTIEENKEKKIVLNGLSYTEAYKISKMENYREDKTLTLVSDASIAVKSNGNEAVMVKQGITGGILSFKIETRSSVGVYIPRDIVSSILDSYKSEGDVYTSGNSNKFDLKQLKSMISKTAESELVEEKNINIAQAKKMFDKKNNENNCCKESACKGDENCKKSTDCCKVNNSCTNSCKDSDRSNLTETEKVECTTPGGECVAPKVDTPREKSVESPNVDNVAANEV